MNELLERLEDAIDPEAFQTALLVEPSDRFFPDVWRGDVDSALKVLGRLAAYADLDCPIEIEVADTNASGAALVEVKDEAVVFEIPSRIDALDAAVFTCLSAREVVRARRLFDGVALDEPADEEAAIDVEGLACGLGILTTNGASMFRAVSLGVSGNQAVSRWQATYAVAMSADELSMLLAVLVLARGSEKGELARIAGLLEANQRETFESTLAATTEAEAQAQLGVSPPSPEDLVSRDEALRCALEAADESADSAAITVTEPERTKIAFVVVPRVGPTTMIVGGLFSLLALGVAYAGTSSLLASLAIAACPPLVMAYGELSRKPHCSNAECERPLTRDATRCEACSAKIVGKIHNRSERLEAEERYERELRSRERGYREAEHE